MSPLKIRHVLSVTLLSTALFTWPSTSAQEFEWARQVGGTMAEQVFAIAPDASGNIHVVGYFEDTVDFDPGAGTSNLISAGGHDAYIWKLTGTGDLVWAKGMGGTALDEAYDVTVDEAGNVYTVGVFFGTADFDPGAGTFNMTSAGDRDVFVSKLDIDGNFVWAKQFAGASLVQAYGVSVDSAGKVYIVGGFRGMVDFDPGAGTFNLTSAGGDEAFLAKLDGNGDLAWALRVGAGSNDAGHDVALDNTGMIYVIGSFAGTVDFDPGPGVFNLTSGGSDDAFVLKLDNGGNFVWAARMGGSQQVIAWEVALDDSGNPHTVGEFNGTADFDPGAGTANLTSSGSVDGFISKLDSSGNFVWGRGLGGAGQDDAKAVAVDASGNVYTSGLFSGTVDFDPGAGTLNLTSAGGVDAFLSKLDSAGDYVWSGQFGGVGNENPHAVALDRTANIYIGGHFTGTSDVDPGPGVFNLVPAGGTQDGFLVKLSQATATVTPSLTDPATGSTIVACIDIDTRSKLLGSYGATLTWDPAVLNYISYSGGDSPFDTPVVNTGNTATGTLAFADADPTGVSGESHVLCVTFAVTGSAGTLSALDIELTSIFEAVTIADLLPDVVEVDGTVNSVVACTIGDVNGDSAINSGDALLILSDEIGLTIPPTAADRIAARCGDADGDGDTDSADANVVLSFEVGLDVSGNPINGSNVTTDDCSACSASRSYAVLRSSPGRSRPVRANVVASRAGVRENEPFEALIVLDTRFTGMPLGSYTARLAWDTDAVEFLGALGGGTPGFESPMMNSNDASRGDLRFTDANPIGAGGKIDLLRVQFRARRFIRNPARELRLSFSSMASTAPEFEELVPLVGTRPFLGTGKRRDLLQRRKP